MISPCLLVVTSDWCWGNVDGVELDVGGGELDIDGGDGTEDGACDGASDVVFDDEV
jgi:hypothetical protein